MYCERKCAFLVGIVFYVMIISCGIFIPEKQDIEPCPWEPESVGHWMRLPLTITPHKEVYRVGDTVRFSFHESVMLRDSNMRRNFDLSSFPFRPVHFMWRFEDDNETYFTPLSEENIILEERFRPELLSGRTGLGYRMWATIENDSFLAYSDVILKEPGKYISTWYDVYTVTVEAAGGDRSYAEPIEFEGKCDGHYFLIENYVKGESYLENYIPELKEIDTLYYNKLVLEGAERGSGLDRGNFSADHNAFFGFEVRN